MQTTTAPAVYEWTGPTGKHFVQKRSPAGTYYHQETPQAVRDILDNAIKSTRRYRFWYGDTATGESWHDDYFMLGYIRRSMGPISIPIVCPNRNSHGGPAILDSCIIAIADAPGHFVYRHPTLDLGRWEVGPPQHDEYAAAAYCDGSLHARFKTSDGARRYCGFMRGERFSK